MARPKQAKQKKCKVCRAEFVPSKPMQKVCGYECATQVAKLAHEKRAARLAKDDRRETRAKLEKLKTKGEYIKEAQAAFNKFIRLRDAGLPCICCGRPMGPNIPGGAVDAGHWRSRGSAPHLRFDERNVHAQRKQCNRFESGNYAGMKVGMIERLGLEAVEALEADQTPRNYTVDDLKSIRDTYRAKARQMEKANG